MGKTDVLVIGGSAAGIVAAVTGKNNYPDKDFLVIRKENQVVVPCGIPYIFGSLDGTDKNVIPDAELSNAGVDIKIGQVVFIDPDKKVCKTDDGTEINFELLRKLRYDRWRMRRILIIIVELKARNVFLKVLSGNVC